MANSIAFVAAAASGILAVHFLVDSPSPIVYFRAVLSAISLTFIGSLVYSKFIYINYRSPLRHLPEIKRKSWKEAFSLLSPPQYLDAIDNIPNDGLLWRKDMLNREVIVLTTTPLISEWLQQRPQDYHKIEPIRRVLIDMLGHGLASAEDHDHRRQRKALAPAFGVGVIKPLYPLFWNRAGDMIKSIKSEVQSQSKAGLDAIVDIDDWSGRVALDIIGEAGFGSSFDALGNPQSPLNKNYRAAFVVDANTRALFVLALLTTPALVNMLPLDKVKAKLNGFKHVRLWIRDVIEKRSNANSSNSAKGDYLDNMGHKDIISSVMKAGALNVDGLIEQSLTFLGAGHETSATSISWAIHELSQPEYQHHQTALREEIRAHLPSPSSGTPITSELLDSLPLLNATIHENFRLHAPVVTIGRVAIRDTVLGGVHIPEGTQVRCSPYGMGRSKKLWGDDALEFNPNRWFVKGNGEVKGKDDHLLVGMTFGHGPRGCIGKGFALAEAKAVLASLVGSFEFKQIGNKHVDPESVYGITGKILGVEVETAVVEGW